MVLKWGIVSVGKISTDFTKSLLLFSKSEHEIVAVAARQKERAEEFAKTYNIPVVYGDYKSLANDSNVEVVYIGSIHPQHFEISKLMLEHGKHVLCEKPLTMNEKQTRELTSFARESKLFLMEGIWSRCFPAYEEIKKQIQSGAIGEVKQVVVPFGRKLNHIERIYEKSLGGGIILDLGVYTLQFQQFIFNNIKPKQFIATGHLNSKGTDESAFAILTYEDGKTAVLSANSLVNYDNEALVIGTEGTLRMPMFWCPTELVTPKGTMKFDLPPSGHQSTRPGGFTHEIAEVAQCIKQGLLESPKITHQESIQLAKWMDFWMKEVGVVYDSDE